MRGILVILLTAAAMIAGDGGAFADAPSMVFSCTTDLGTSLYRVGPQEYRAFAPATESHPAGWGGNDCDGHVSTVTCTWRRGVLRLRDTVWTPPSVIAFDTNAATQTLSAGGGLQTTKCIPAEDPLGR